MLSLMHLDSETGEVVVVERVDREQFAWLNFTVQAMDSGVPPLTSAVDVVVQVSASYYNHGKCVLTSLVMHLIVNKTCPSTKLTLF